MMDILTFNTVCQVFYWGTGVFWSYFLYIYAQQCFTYRSFRGPMIVPFLGNIYSFEPLFFLKYIGTLSKNYGTVFTFFCFTKPYLVLCEPYMVRRIFSDTKVFTKGKDYTETFAMVFGKGLVTSVGEKHKKDRSVFGKYFIKSNIVKFTQTINDITDKSIEDRLSTGQAFNIEDFFAILSFRVFMGFSCSSNLADKPELEAKLCHEVASGSNAMGVLVITSPVMIPSYMNQIKKIRKDFDALFDDMVKKRRIEMETEEEKKDDCLQAMIDTDMTRQEINDHLTTLLCAGHDTTAYFASYMSYLLAANPNCQDKLYQEILSTVGEGESITADHIVDMKYLTKVMQETMRIYAIIPMVTRTTTEDVDVKDKDGTGSVSIPKGTNIIIPMFLINRDPTLWENPLAFNPDRFDDSELNFTSAKNGFFPFGYGSRTCIGNTLAQIESAIFMCKILLKFRIDPDPKFKPQVNSGISLTTLNGINVVLNPRGLPVA